MIVVMRSGASRDEIKLVEDKVEAVNFRSGRCEVVQNGEVDDILFLFLFA